MAKNAKLVASALGKYLVDDNICLDHECCVEAAPNNFMMTISYSAYVYKQPATPEEALQCREAFENCPVGAIRTDGFMP